jgi:DNA-binding NarL/FixJ family response regulator
VRFEAECGTGATTPMLTVFEEVSAILEAVTLDRDAARAARIRAPYGLLTPREAEVLTLLARGRTDGEIAAELYISPKTASVHVANIKGKLGVDTRVEAALLARELVGA